MTWLLRVKNAVGIGAVLGVFYLSMPWALLSVLKQGENISTDEFTMAIEAWATGIVDNMLLLGLLLLIAVLTYGPEVLDLVVGREERGSPPGPRL